MRRFAMRRGLRFSDRRLVITPGNGNVRQQQGSIYFPGPCARAPGLSDDVCSKLVKQLGYTINAPGRLHHDDQVLGTGSCPGSDLQPCASKLRLSA